MFLLNAQPQSFTIFTTPRLSNINNRLLVAIRTKQKIHTTLLQSFHILAFIQHSLWNFIRHACPISNGTFYATTCISIHEKQFNRFTSYHLSRSFSLCFPLHQHPQLLRQYVERDAAHASWHFAVGVDIERHLKLHLDTAGFEQGNAFCVGMAAESQKR